MCPFCAGRGSTRTYVAGSLAELRPRQERGAAGAGGAAATQDALAYG